MDSTTLVSDEEHLNYMRIALATAEEATPVSTAFCVGCVLVVRPPSMMNEPAFVLATGYSRELAGNTHAEANALAKALTLSSQQLSTLCPSLASHDINSLFSLVDVYTTMEPCSVRSSGLAPCANALIAANVKRCFIGVHEPPDFVQCEGAERLSEAGVEVIWLKGMESECLQVARRDQQ